MAAEVSVVTDPLIVYAMVGILLGALVLALVFARPRRGLGAVNGSDVPPRMPTDEPWMPGGDIFGHDQEPPTASPTPAGGSPVAPAPSIPPAQHDPWSTGASTQSDAPPPWGRR